MSLTHEPNQNKIYKLHQNTKTILLNQFNFFIVIDVLFPGEKLLLDKIDFNACNSSKIAHSSKKGQKRAQNRIKSTAFFVIFCYCELFLQFSALFLRFYAIMSYFWCFMLLWAICAIFCYYELFSSYSNSQFYCFPCSSFPPDFFFFHLQLTSFHLSPLIKLLILIGCYFGFLHFFHFAFHAFWTS